MPLLKTALLLFAFFSMSCELIPGLNDLATSVTTLDPLGEGEFYAQNMLPSNSNYYKLSAEKVVEGESCVIWAEKKSKVSKEQAQQIANMYDKDIRSKMVNAFSKKDFEGFDDMLTYANWLTGGTDQKLTILLLDIRDSYGGRRSDSYVAGYFSSANFYEKGSIEGTNDYSNAKDMIYLDTYPGLQQGFEQIYMTLAHELQHLINYVTSKQMGRRTVDTWINEGLSSQAEYLYLEANPSDKHTWFNSDVGGTLTRGNNFYVWNNRQDISNANLADYATVYLFFRWLYLQAEAASQSRILYEIETAAFADYRAVTEIAAGINPEWGEWENLLRAWFAANCYPRGANAYNNDEVLREAIQVKTVSGKSIALYPGEGVYSVMSKNFTHDDSGNIRYAGLNGTSVTTGQPYSGDILLTFNANINRASNPETGYLAAGNSSAGRFRSVAENVQMPAISGPYVIDAGDLIGRNE